jgi:hypothetical protein
MYSRDHAADDAVDELVTLAGSWGSSEPDVAVLAAAAGLAHELPFLLDRLRMVSR